MSNTNPSVPSSPSELFKLNEEAQLAASPTAFYDAIQELQEELEPSPAQALTAVTQIVEQLAIYHFNTLHSADDLELSPYQRELWATDYKSLKKALHLLRTVSQD